MAVLLVSTSTAENDWTWVVGTVASMSSCLRRALHGNATGHASLRKTKRRLSPTRGVGLLSEGCPLPWDLPPWSSHPRSSAVRAGTSESLSERTTPSLLDRDLTPARPSTAPSRKSSMWQATFSQASFGSAGQESRRLGEDIGRQVESKRGQRYCYCPVPTSHRVPLASSPLPPAATPSQV